MDFLGFLWPNRDFSKGYSESKQKKLPRLSFRLRQVVLGPHSLTALATSIKSCQHKKYTTDFRFLQNNSRLLSRYLWSASCGFAPERLPFWPGLSWLVPAMTLSFASRSFQQFRAPRDQQRTIRAELAQTVELTEPGERRFEPQKLSRIATVKQQYSRINSCFHP
ncbi:MAG TPA: hypothetical protein VIJ63_19120 [Roseiarcus sp.]